MGVSQPVRNLNDIFYIYTNMQLYAAQFKADIKFMMYICKPLGRAMSGVNTPALFFGQTMATCQDCDAKSSAGGKNRSIDIVNEFLDRSLRARVSFHPARITLCMGSWFI
jgi:hypothetical protein